MSEQSNDLRSIGRKLRGVIHDYLTHAEQRNVADILAEADAALGDGYLAQAKADADKSLDDKGTDRLLADVLGVKHELEAHRRHVREQFGSLTDGIVNINRRIDRLKVIDPGHN